jgi:hypothetical protein
MLKGIKHIYVPFKFWLWQDFKIGLEVFHEYNSKARQVRFKANISCEPSFYGCFIRVLVVGYYFFGFAFSAAARCMASS